MFDKMRYLTRGINAEVSISIQMRLWQMIETMDPPKDYLQVFILEQLPDRTVRITHRQEEPEYENTVQVVGELSSENLRIFVIDDGDYSTMLLASEY